MATLDELTERIRGAVGQEADLGNSIKLDLKGEGFIHIEGAQVTNEDKPADLVVTVSVRDLKAMGKGELDPMRAMMTGRLRLSDMGLALKLQPKIQSLFSNAG
jgi:putative sterol carrier protein